MEQSAACTTSTRAVIERLHTFTEDTPVLHLPAPFGHFYVILAPNTNALTD